METMIKKIAIYSVGFALILTGITYMISQDIYIAIGILIGTIARLAGLNSIVKMTNKIEHYQNPSAKGTKNYLGRFVFYGLVIGISIYRKVNIIALLVGFLIMNIVIVIVTQMEGVKMDGS